MNYDPDINMIVQHLEEELHDHILNNPEDYAAYLTTTVDWVPYGSTHVSLPAVTEIDDRKYMAALERAAEWLWEDGKIDVADGYYVMAEAQNKESD